VFTEQPLLPTNFVMTENNKDGVSSVFPAFIDNQIIYVDQSGNNIKTMVWEFQQSKYVLNNNSVTSSTLIKNPVDMSAFTDPNVADGYFVIVVNGDGTLAILQTLKAEQIKAWTPQLTQSSPDNGLTYDVNKFIRITSALNWCWFVVQRYTYTINTTTNITAFFGPPFNLLVGVNFGIPLDTPGLIQFVTGGGIILPTTVPQVVGGVYYWAVPIGNINQILIFATESDAINFANPLIHSFTVLDAGTNAQVNYYTTASSLTLESLNFNSYTDQTLRFPSLNANLITGLNGTYEGNWVSMILDGYVYPNAQVTDGDLQLPVVAVSATIGLPYTSNFSPLPYANLPNGVGLYSPKHIKGFYLNYYNSLGIQIQGYDIPDLSLNNFLLNVPPPLVSGVYLFGMMEDWDPFSYVINVTQSNPLPMTILGIGYVLEV
jgi:hypothetical protein